MYFKKTLLRSFWIIAAILLTLPATGFAKLSNPLGSNVTIEIVIGRVIRALLGLSGSIALLMFVWGGFLWMTSAGSPEKVKKGKDTLVWATIGLVVIFAAYTLVNAVIDAIAAP